MKPKVDINLYFLQGTENWIGHFTDIQSIRSVMWMMVHLGHTGISCHGQLLNRTLSGEMTLKDLELYLDGKL